MSERAYLDLLKSVLDHGKPRADRTGTGTRAQFGGQMRFDLRSSFPLLTTKKVHLKSIVHELLWFVRGSRRRAAAQRRGGLDLGRVGDGRADGALRPRGWRARARVRPPVAQLRGDEAADGTYERDGFDQLAGSMRDIRENPMSRRLLVTGWNPVEADQVALPPCHTLFQFHVQDGELSCQLYQRSGDVFLGVPFNIASYALLTLMVAQSTGLKARRLRAQLRRRAPVQQPRRPGP
jgi:thymidylate synthase